MPRKARTGPSTNPSLEDLAPGLTGWVEDRTGGRVVRAEPHPGGNNRIAWQVDVDEAGAQRALFLTLPTPGAGAADGNARDGALLAALAGTPVPVPTVVGRGGPGAALLTQRVAGRSDAPSGPDLDPVLADLMHHLAALHQLTPASLELPELAPPSSVAGLALDQLGPIEARYRRTPAARHPLVDFGLGWLRRHAPQQVPGVALVHGDAGPGNLIYEAGRVQALVDWEIAHWGDPMEDLAALSTRDMSTPIGAFERRLAEYQAAGGAHFDALRLRYYRVLVLVRNSALICLTLADAAESPALQALRPFALLLRRAASQALCEASGHAFPLEAEPGAPTDELPDAPLDADDLWIPLLAERARAECAAQRELMGPLADRFLQPVPA